MCIRDSSALARRDAFLDAMRELGLKVPKEHLVEGDHTMEGGITAAEMLIALSVLCLLYTSRCV